MNIAAIVTVMVLVVGVEKS